MKQGPISTREVDRAGRGAGSRRVRRRGSAEPHALPSLRPTVHCVVRTLSSYLLSHRSMHINLHSFLPTAYIHTGSTSAPSPPTLPPCTRSSARGCTTTRAGTTTGNNKQTRRPCRRMPTRRRRRRQAARWCRPRSCVRDTWIDRKIDRCIHTPPLCKRSSRYAHESRNLETHIESKINTHTEAAPARARDGHDAPPPHTSLSP